MKRKIASILACLLAVVTLCGCSGDTVRLSYYDSTLYKANTLEYNSNLFYKNNHVTPVPDPCAIYIDDIASEYYGWFFLYGTIGGRGFSAYRSKDLYNWEPIGSVLTIDRSAGNSAQSNAMYTYFWAPEVIFDKEDGKYHMFFSAGRRRLIEGTNVWVEEKKHVAYHAVSDSPAGPFELSNDAANDGRQINIEQDKWSLFDLRRFSDKLIADGYSGDGSFQNYILTIDAHPFIDPVTGTRYLYIRADSGSRARIIVVEMETWDKPKYDTITTVIVARQNHATDTSLGNNPYESSTYTNEGPYVYYHNGKYYMTLSVYGFKQANYTVYQAVSDSPLEPFRKLTIEEGGVLMTSDAGLFDNVAATGHHSFVTVDDELIMVYHAYNNSDADGTRCVYVDEMKWVTVKDIYGNDLEVMYANGPTTAPQPRFNFNAEYVNVAEKAKVKAGGIEGEASALTDGLVAINANANIDFINKYVPSVKLTEKAEITLTFDDYIPVRAVMVYNSNLLEETFEQIDRIDFKCKDENGKKYKAFIENLARDEIGGISSTGFSVRPGAAAIAEFYEMKVKEITFTVSVPEGKERVSFSEIVVLGK